LRRRENMNQDKIVEMLKNYRSYKFAVSNGIAGYDPCDNTGMPRGGGYSSREPRLGGGSTFQSELDYRLYKGIVTSIEGAVSEVLDDDQATVIRRKYLDRNKRTLAQIAAERNVDPTTVTRWHKIALKQLSVALALVEPAEIINLDDVLKPA
jgi:hypothetical protein